MSLVIAEIGTSHQGSLEKARALVDTAVNAGADCVKFQWVYAREILHPCTGFVKLPTGNIPLYDRFRELECPPSFYKEMCDYAHSKNLLFCCSPFGLQSLEELLEIKPDSVKIASPELNHFPMLERLRDYRKEQKDKGENPIPVILSSGVSKMEDIEAAIEILGTENVSLLHCITSYPAPEDEYNVSVLKTFSEKWNIETRISDHSLDPILVPVLTIYAGGSIIEKHITLSRETDGLDDPVALDGEMFGTMVHCVKQAETVLHHYGEEKGRKEILSQLSESAPVERLMKILGDGEKKLAPSEEANYGRTNRSLHFMRAMNAGETVCEKDIAVLRTEKVLSPGISPKFYKEIIGKKLKISVENGSGVLHELFE